MRLVQFLTKQGERRVAVTTDQTKGALALLSGTDSVYQLALAAISNEMPISELAARRTSDELVDYETVVSVGRLLPPLDHPKDPAHCVISGTGLTHLHGANAQQASSKDRKSDTDTDTDAGLSDSVKLFRLGLERGKPKDGGIGAQPEWFYKGDGSCVVAPEHPFRLPDYALDGSDEAEIVGLYVIADDGTPYRVGFALGNEFSDHVLESRNALYLANAKLRQCAYGPELLLGELPTEVCGNSRLLRDAKVVWEKPFSSGEAHMTHTVAGLEQHHFKHAQFRRPGDVHVHFLGAAMLSYADDIKTRAGDLFEISAEGFGRPLRNPLKQAPAAEFEIRVL